MSSFELLCRSLLQGAGQQLVYSSFLAALVGLICYRLQLSAPRLQLGLWSLVVLRLILPPNLSLPWSFRALLERWSWLDPSGVTTDPGPSFLGPSVFEAATPSAVSPTSYWPLILCALWLAGSVTVAARLLWRWQGYRSIALAATPLAGGAWQRLLEQWSQRMGVLRKVQLVASNACSEPFTVGWLKPRIFLPLSLVQQQPWHQLEAVVAHEMAHVRRRDSLWIGLQCILRAVYFFHPALWLAASRLDQARERVCDEMVLATGAIGRRQYGECLLASLKRQVSPNFPDGAIPVPTFGNDKRRMSMRLLGIVRFRPSHPCHRVAALMIPWILGVLLLPMGTVEASWPSLSSATSSSLAITSEPAATASQDTPLHWSSPLPGARVTSPFGFRKSPLKKDSETHRGIDLVGAKGAEILAPADGRVEIATELLEGHKNLGTTILLDHGNGTKSRYAHLDSLLVEEQQTVRAGQPIGIQGNTGVSSGPHLHFEVWRDGEAIDPAKVVKQW